MKISLKWLQEYFDQPLPSVDKLKDAFTFHAFEVEEMSSVDGSNLMDLNVLPNRAADCLCHRGIAKELSAILDIKLKKDPFQVPVENKGFVNPYLKIEIEDEKKCLRYIGALVKGVKVGPSPDWLREALESIGQRSINNIVDAANYVMFNIGQPLHAFDAGKLAKKDGTYVIGVRDAKDGEKITVLTGEEYNLSNNTLVIVDANTDVALGVAGIKGGKVAEISSDTTDIIIEAANFDGTSIRRSAQALRLVTDASLRFQNRPSPELCGYGMRDAVALMLEVAGGEFVCMVDEYPSNLEQNKEVMVSLQKINNLLGYEFSKSEVENVFNRLGFDTKIDGEVFLVTPPFERTDIAIPENLVEEVGRIMGYDKIAPIELPMSDLGGPTSNQARYRGIEKVKDFLIERGFIEISTQSFAREGDVYLANPIDKTKPALRKNLKENMKEALERANYVAPLVLAPNEKPKLFEIGTVFPKKGEELIVETSEPVLGLPEIDDDQSYEPRQYRLGAFRSFSAYPFVTRDIALWLPADANDGHTMSIIKENAGELLVRVDQFDRFEKDGKLSLAFRLVFQSMERTLTDEEVNEIMKKITTVLTEKGYEVR